MMTLLLTLSFVSCMEVEQPVCNANNRVDLTEMPSNLVLNYYDQQFNLVTIKNSVKRIGKGIYKPALSTHTFEVCQYGSKTLIQTKTEFNTYKLLGFTKGEDSFSMPDYIIDTKILDRNGLNYRYVQRPQLDAKIRAFVGNTNQETLVVEKIPAKLVDDLLPLAAGAVFKF